MVVSLTADFFTVTTTQGLGFVNSITRDNNLNFYSNLSIQSAAVLDAIAPPTVRSSSVRTIRRTHLRKRRRTRRKTYLGGESDDGGDSGEELEYFGGDGGGFTGSGGGSWGGGGGGWNFHRFGGQNWDESSWFPASEFAYGFIYEVIYWIALSTCLHFAFEKVMRIMGGGVVDDGREKGSMRLGSVC